ncbi:MAG: lytic murein transglycosylase [Parvibaculaceae bacterium]
MPLPKLLALAACLALMTLAGAPAMAQTRAAVEASFRQWVEGVRKEALAEGVKAQTFDSEMDSVRLDWSLPDLVPPGKKKESDAAKVSQAEFGSPGAYFEPGMLQRRIRDGRQELANWGKTLAAIEKRYGVPGRVLLAIWARESAYGKASIPHDALTVLATQAFMGRRPETFRPQLIAALKLLQDDRIPRKILKSSWAGAMGHMQMLPAVVLKYGIDFDGDGHPDIWSSVPDALATAANFLRQKGWKPGAPWGYEVAVPARVACSLEGPHQGRTFAEWQDLGLERTGGRKWPAGRAGEEGFLLMPAGRFGPAFLVTGNFYALKEYNTSDLYALYIGHLADRMGEDRGFEGRWDKVPTYTRGQVKALQETLSAHGYNIGETLDGLIGFRTRVAVGLYQEKTGLPVNCWPGPETMARAKREG